MRLGAVRKGSASRAPPPFWLQGLARKRGMSACRFAVRLIQNPRRDLVVLVCVRTDVLSVLGLPK